MSDWQITDSTMTARQLYIQDPSTQRITFTRKGIETYGAKFARAGFNIRNIKTMAEFERAVDASFALEMRSLASTAKGSDKALDDILAGLPGWD